MNRALLLLLVLCACKRDPVATAAGELSAPAALHFGTRFVGYSTALTLEVDGRGQSGRHATVSVQAPFSVDHDGLDVPGGGSASVNVSFTPTAPGPASAVLTIATDDQLLTVMLDGTGMAQPVCTPSAACRDSRFVLDAGACVETVSPDKTPCTSQVACLDSAECLGGECVGQAAVCTDGNACTEDACDLAAGCIHFDVSARCPEASDPCHAASCDVDAGCGITEAPDGTLCGPHDCTTASVCLAGVCKPNVGVPEGFECAPASPCQAAGHCHNQVCVQPPPGPLVPAWTYDPWPNGSIASAPIADSAGNAYWLESGGSSIALVSVTPQGFMRFRVTADDYGTGLKPLFIAGEAIVYEVIDSNLPNPVIWRARSARDGSLLWDVDLLAQGRTLVADQGLELNWSHAAAVKPGEVWFTYEVTRSTDSTPVRLARGSLVSAVALDGGALLWATRVRDAGIPSLFTGVTAGNYYDGVAADEAHDLYVTLIDPPGDTLVSVAPGGIERWRRPIHGVPTAAYGARLAIVPVDADAGSVTLSCIDGSLQSDLELDGLTGPPALSAFDGAKGFAVQAVDAGALYGDCNDDPSLQAYELFAWDLSSGHMLYHVPVGPYFATIDRPADLSSFTLLSDRTVLMADLRFTCDADGGLAQSGSSAMLRRVGLDGKDVFSCPGAGAEGPLVPLGGERWLLRASPVDHDIIEALDLPGVTPSAHGWITSGGNPGGGAVPR